MCFTRSFDKRNNTILYFTCVVHVRGSRRLRRSEILRAVCKYEVIHNNAVAGVNFFMVIWTSTGQII